MYTTAKNDKPQIIVRPQPGFQERALACTADIAVLGGSAGCGKSWCSIMEPTRFVDVKDFNAIIFRRTYPEIVGGGSIWEEASKVYPHFGGVSKLGKLQWRFPNDTLIQFSHLQHEADKYKHQSKQYALIIFEEGTHFSESQFWYLASRARTTCGVKPYIRITCNPDPDSFIAKLVEWWIGADGIPIPTRAGVVRFFVRRNDALVWGATREELRQQFGQDTSIKSFTFI